MTTALAVRLARIRQCALETLARQPPLPTPGVPAMTAEEYQIYRALCAALGALQSIADWCDGPEGPEEDAPCP